MNATVEDEESTALSAWAHYEQNLMRRFFEETFLLTNEENFMSLLAKQTTGDFSPPPEGLHVARCYAVVDMGAQYSEKYKKSLQKVLIGWELPNVLTEKDEPSAIMERYTISLNEGALLRERLEAWRGRSFTPEELLGFHLKNILGKTCYLTIKHKNGDNNKKWPEIVSISPLPKSEHCPEQFNKTIYFNLDEFTAEAYNAVPEGIRKKINLGDHASGNHAPSEDSAF